MRKRIGPGMLPCGTTDNIGNRSDYWPLIETHCSLPKRYALNHNHKSSVIPIGAEWTARQSSTCFSISFLGKGGGGGGGESKALEPSVVVQYMLTTTSTDTSVFESSEDDDSEVDMSRSSERANIPGICLERMHKFECFMDAYKDSPI